MKLSGSTNGIAEFGNEFSESDAQQKLSESDFLNVLRLKKR